MRFTQKKKVFDFNSGKFCCNEYDSANANDIRGHKYFSVR